MPWTHYKLFLFALFCLEIDECLTNNGGCEHNCTNTDGSFFCSCDSGYELDSDMANCSGDKLHAVTVLVRGRVLSLCACIYQAML